MLKLLTELLTAVINRLITRLEIGAGFWPVMIYELDKNRMLSSSEMILTTIT